jgi:hypothetical protein
MVVRFWVDRWWCILGRWWSIDKGDVFLGSGLRLDVFQFQCVWRWWCGSGDGGGVLVLVVMVGVFPDL